MAEELALADDLGADVRLLDMVDERGGGKARGVVDVKHFALHRIDFVGDVGDGRNHVHIEFAEEPFLHDFEVQQAEESASEAAAEGERALGLIYEGGVVELELLQHGAELFELVGLHGVHTREHHRLHFLEAGDCLLTGARGVRDGVAHLDFHGALDAGDDVAYVTAAHFRFRDELHLQGTHLFDFVFHSRGHELDLVSFAHAAVADLEICDDAAERVEHGVENQGLQGGVRVAFRGGNLLHDGIQDWGHAFTGTGRHAEDIVRVAAQQVADFVGDKVRLGRIHIYLVEYGDDLEAVVYGHIEVGDGLGLHALGGVHHQQRAFAGGDASRDFIGEVHVAGSVDEVEAVAVVIHLDSVALDGDALFLLKVHIVQHLILHIAGGQGAGQFEEPVGQRALAVVDMRYYAEIAYSVHFHIGYKDNYF